ncbi:hypothetical protein MTP99_002183 [Tenebrio molitor]|nr:hypothetical protein MTP99_002183 [Tenebrio molitor]
MGKRAALSLGVTDQILGRLTRIAKNHEIITQALQLLSARRSDFYVPDKMKVLDFLANEGPLSQPFGGIYCPEILFT